MFALRSLLTQYMQRVLVESGDNVPNAYSVFFVQHMCACALAVSASRACPPPGYA